MATNEAAVWDITWAVEKRLGDKIYLKDGEKYFKGRRVIDRYSPVDGGVYLGKSGGEAIVVDSEKYPILRELHEEVKSKATENIFGKKEKRIIHAVYDTVAEAMPMQDVSEVERVVRSCNVSKDGRISLGTFLEQGVGVSRHDALACAVLLELSKKDGIIEGTPSVDRNTVGYDTYVWCRYKNPKGKIFILDVRKGFVGELSRASGETGWPYERPNDL